MSGDPAGNRDGRGYRPIADYGVIGDMHSAALIASDGAIDWACLPYFDSPPVFFRLLDQTSGGYCVVELAGRTGASRKFIEGTNILETTFTSNAGSITLTDFMPVQPGPESRQRCSRMIRLVRCTAGQAEIRFECRPTLSFHPSSTRPRSIGSHAIRFEEKDQRVVVEGPNLSVRSDDTVTATANLRAAETAWFAISSASDQAQYAALDADSVSAALDQTRRYWKAWSGRLDYQGDYGDEVRRSILSLKLLIFAPTGAIVAAPTTSLPERIGGDWNWDYRFSWIRDSQFVLTALMHCGYEDEAHEFFRFLKQAAGGPVDQLDILYEIRGKRAGEEKNFAGLEGYRGSRPVRVGNAAARQKQLDIYGELLNCMFVYCHLASKEEKAHRVMESWQLAQGLADHVVRHWREPDQGIWESRGPARQFVHSKAMCWTALDRAIRLAFMGKVKFDVAPWERERAAIHESVIAQGYNADIGAFVQSYGSQALDASVLRLPLQAMIPAGDSRMLSTIRQIERQLLRNGLVMRQTDSQSSQKGAFTSCTLWLVNNYILLGRMDQAKEMLDHLLSFQNDLGLYSEEIDTESGQQLGNFPQALTHVALISAIRHLEGLRPGSLHALA